jgi:hypothetical protein
MKLFLYAIIAAQSSITLLVALLPLFDRMRNKHGHHALNAG